MGFYDVAPHDDPPKYLCIGPDAAGNLLEMIYLQFADRDLIIHAMRLRRGFERHLLGLRR